MEYIIIANPHSGGGMGNKQFDLLIQYCKTHNLSYVSYLTQYGGEVYQIIKKLLPTLHANNRIIIIGGDGTLNESIASLIKFNQSIPIAYLPAGTGNDFSREMNFTNNIPTFMERLENEVVSTLELLSFNEKLSHTTGIAINSLGFGLDAAICQLNTIQSKKQKSKFGLSKFSYLTPIINAFKKHKEFQASIQINDQPVQISDKNLLVGLFNHSYFGGGIRFVPTAKQNSHNFEVVVARDVTAPVILKAFPFILWNKQHFERFPENLLKQTATTASIKIEQPILMQTDGEFYSFEEVELEARLITYPIYLT